MADNGPIIRKERVSFSNSELAFINHHIASIVGLLNFMLELNNGRLPAPRLRACIVAIVEGVRNAMHVSFGIAQSSLAELDFDRGLDDMLKTPPPPADGV